MATLKQIQANRLNAQNSTGPASAEGKSRSRQNALKSGIDAESEVLPWEDPAERAALSAEYHDHHLPHTPEARQLVDNLAHYEFLNRRFRRAEVKILTSKLPPGADPKDAVVIGKAWCDASAELARLQRRIDANNRNFHRDLDQLRLLEAQPAAAQVPPDPVVLSTAQATEPTTETDKSASFLQLNVPLRPRGFNPRNPDHGPIEKCPQCLHNGKIRDDCYFTRKQ